MAVVIPAATADCGGPAPPNFGVSTEFLNPHSHGGVDRPDLGFDAGVFVWEGAVLPDVGE
jgi:hypothetical protein